AGGDYRTRRLAFWGTLALMRCVGSSPAAAISALTNRLAGIADEASVEPSVFDIEEGLLSESDIEPATGVENREERAALERLITAAHALDAKREQDPKAQMLLSILSDLVLKKNAKPVIFCRFIATAHMLGEVIR